MKPLVKLSVVATALNCLGHLGGCDTNIVNPIRSHLAHLVSYQIKVAFTVEFFVKQPAKLPSTATGIICLGHLE
jgi:hypothetical protein